MRSRQSLLVLATACTLSFAAQAANKEAAKSYRAIGEIPIGGDGGWDYLTVDSAARRLYVTHGTKVHVIDLDKNALVGAIEGTPGVHGVALAPDLKLGFTSNGAEGKAATFDLSTLTITSRVETGANPDAILYEPNQREVYTFNGRGHSATVYNAQTGKVMATIALSGKPEFAVEDVKAGIVYNNIEDKNEVVAIDVRSHEVKHTWPAAPCESASGMANDIAHHRLFLGCENKMMVMMDSSTGKVLANVPIGAGVDANAFDPSTQLAFASNGEGNVTIAHEDSPTSLRVVQTLETAKGARTMTLDPVTHKIYLVTADRIANPEPNPTGERRSPYVPGTFKVLVYGLE